MFAGNDIAWEFLETQPQDAINSACPVSLVGAARWIFYSMLYLIAVQFLIKCCCFRRHFDSVPETGTWYRVPRMGTMFKSLNSPEHDRLRAWLKSSRERQNMTMRELAEKLDAPHSFVGKTEQGERRLDVVEYVRYCKALGVDPAEGLSEISSGSRANK